MTVTKQQQLEWLAKHVDEWVNDIPEAYLMSVDEVGFVVGLATAISTVEMIYGRHHAITRKEWQQERDKMQKQQDNSWYERGEFPPVGCECEVKASKDNWVKAFTVGLDIDGAMVVQFIDSTIPFGSCASPSYFRPLCTERENAIDEMVYEFINHYGDPKCGERYLPIAAKLYDAGYRKVNP